MLLRIKSDTIVWPGDWANNVKDPANRCKFTILFLTLSSHLFNRKENRLQVKGREIRKAFNHQELVHQTRDKPNRLTLALFTFRLKSSTAGKSERPSSFLVLGGGSFSTSSS